jgi:hypothetical protein
MYNQGRSVWLFSTFNSGSNLLQGILRHAKIKPNVDRIYKHTLGDNPLKGDVGAAGVIFLMKNPISWAESCTRNMYNASFHPDDSKLEPINRRVTFESTVKLHQTFSGPTTLLDIWMTYYKAYSATAKKIKKCLFIVYEDLLYYPVETLGLINQTFGFSIPVTDEFLAMIFSGRYKREQSSDYTTACVRNSKSYLADKYSSMELLPWIEGVFKEHGIEHSTMNTVLLKQPNEYYEPDQKLRDKVIAYSKRT